jgi:hypothetical protein
VISGVSGKLKGAALAAPFVMGKILSARVVVGRNCHGLVWMGLRQTHHSLFPATNKVSFTSFL